MGFGMWHASKIAGARGSCGSKCQDAKKGKTPLTNMF